VWIPSVTFTRYARSPKTATRFCRGNDRILVPAPAVLAESQEWQHSRSRFHCSRHGFMPSIIYIPKIQNFKHSTPTFFKINFNIRPITQKYPPPNSNELIRIYQKQSKTTIFFSQICASSARCHFRAHDTYRHSERSEREGAPAPAAIHRQIISLAFHQNFSPKHHWHLILFIVHYSSEGKSLAVTPE
jgi:hypothetical protein